MKKILVTGGAGYIGSVLVRILLKKGYYVRIYDNLKFGGESLLGVINEDKLEFIKGDITDEKGLNKAVKNMNYIVHLAAIVGDPACAKEPKLAENVNLNSSKYLFNIAMGNGIERFVFSSTCSNYGKMKNPDMLVDENSELFPISLYAETKVAFEKFMFHEVDKSENISPTCLRFSTVYGLSPRMRFDLTVNEFTKELIMGRQLAIFGKQFWRPYCHVQDLARSVLTVLEAPLGKVAYEVFNVGDTNENYQKQMIVNQIIKFIPESKIDYVKRDEDPRDYKVDFTKIYNELNFKITKRVPDGINEIIQVIKDGIIAKPDSQHYRNT